MDKAAAKLTATIPLSVPIPVAASDGKTAHRARLTMHRPKVRHAKRLAALIGQDIVAALMDEAEQPLAALYAQAQKAEGRAFIKNLLGKLLQRDSLDELTAIVADMCDEEPAVIDELDLGDLVEVGSAFLSFFPALRSLTSGVSLTTSVSTTGGFPAT